MRALFKALLKGSGTPVLQTLDGGEETILSAGNIWTSAHTRRIALSDAGLARGGLVGSAAGGFQAIIDFVACAIGGFVYLPLSPEGWARLRADLAARPVEAPAGTMLIGADGASTFHPGVLPAALGGAERLAGCQLVLAGPGGATCFTGAALESGLAALAARLATPQGGTRLSACGHHHAIGFVVDTLLALTRRQTIYLRRPDPARPAAQWIAEFRELGVEDLVMPPALLAASAPIPAASRSPRPSGRRSPRCSARSLPSISMRAPPPPAPARSSSSRSSEPHEGVERRGR